MAKRVGAEEWNLVVEEWKRSGCPNIAAWCRARCLPYRTFLNWKLKLEGQSQPQDKQGFVALQDEESELKPISIWFGRYRISIEGVCDEEALIQCLKVLKALPC